MKVPLDHHRGRERRLGAVARIELSVEAFSPGTFDLQAPAGRFRVERSPHLGVGLDQLSSRQMRKLTAQRLIAAAPRRNHHLGLRVCGAGDDEGNRDPPH
ncbi:MAG: hypothetical protein QM723_09820 [Myxococcaceae bacterium]